MRALGLCEEVLCIDWLGICLVDWSAVAWPVGLATINNLN